MSESRAFDILSRVLRLSDADGVLARFGAGSQAATRMADNVITQNTEKQGLSLWVSCAYGASHGEASTTDVSEGSLRTVVRTAQAIARVSPPDPEHMPPVNAAERKKYLRIGAFAGRTIECEPRERAAQLAAAAARTRSRKLRLSGAFISGGGWHALANSAGLKAFHRSTSAEVHLTVLSPTGSGWAQAISNDVSEIDVARVAEEAAEIALRSQRPGKLPARKYTVILRPAATAELLEFLFYGGFDAKATDEGHTFLRGKLGRTVCGANVTLRTDPADKRCPGWPFLDDGLAARPLDWIRNGTVTDLIYSRFWAKKRHRQPTGWPSNLIMEGGTASVDDMIRSTGRGLLVTRFWYIRYVDHMVPSVTGMTRDGLFLIEDGRVTRPVRQMRFNENVLGVLNRVEMLGTPRRAGEGNTTLVPALKVRDFNFTSTTGF